MESTFFDLVASYHRDGGLLSREIEVQPWLCEFWPLDEISKLNDAYEVATYAPGFLGFATSAGGEMYAIAPSGAVVCLAFIGMSPQETLPIAKSWREFVGMLQDSSAL